MSIVTLPKLATSEDDTTQATLVQFDKADAFAGPIVVAGALVDSPETWARISQAITTLSREHDCESSDCAGVTLERETAAYQIGLCVGLRLARAVDGGAR